MTLLEFVDVISSNQINEKNFFKNQKHEKKFANFFISKGFESIDKKNDLSLIAKKTKSLTHNENLKSKYFFISQPFGSQQTPDFIFVIDGWVIWIELKRSKGKSISWNTGFPKDNYLYIFDSEKLGRIIFFGQDHPSYGGKEEKYLEITKKIKILSEELFSNTDFKHYYRKMLNDSGNYDKELLKSKVYDLIKRT